MRTSRMAPAAWDQDMQIFIPTAGRVGNQKTLQWLLDAGLESRTWLVVPGEEAKSHDHPNVLVCRKKGVAAARQHAVESSSSDLVFFFDDDLHFDARRPEEKNHFRRATPKDLAVALGFCEYLMRTGFAAAGIRTRHQANTRHEVNYDIHTRMMRAFGVRRDVLREHGIQFDRFLYWEDFHVTLSLLRLGYATPNILHVIHDAGQGNADGGVSRYRNTETLRAEQAKFVKHHSPFAVPIEKEVNWKGMQGIKVPDLRVHWKKAYEEGVKANGD